MFISSLSLICLFFEIFHEIDHTYAKERKFRRSKILGGKTADQGIEIHITLDCKTVPTTSRVRSYLYTLCFTISQQVNSHLWFPYNLGVKFALIYVQCVLVQ